METKLCPKCNIEKEVAAFRFKLTKKGVYCWPVCKQCASEDSKEWAKNHKERQKDTLKRNRQRIKQEFPWLLKFNSAKARCEGVNNDHYKYYGAKGILFLLSKEDLEHLWFRDNADLMDFPEIDRIDNKGNYELNNCQFLDRIYHQDKSFMEQYPDILRVGQIWKKNTLIKIWENKRAVCKMSDFTLNKLHKSILDREKYNGFYWIYVDKADLSQYKIGPYVDNIQNNLSTPILV